MACINSVSMHLIGHDSTLSATIAAPMPGTTVLFGPSEIPARTSMRKLHSRQSGSARDARLWIDPSAPDPENDP